MQNKNYSISDTFLSSLSCALCVKWPTLPPPLFGVFFVGHNKSKCVTHKKNDETLTMKRKGDKKGR